MLNLHDNYSILLPTCPTLVPSFYFKVHSLSSPTLQLTPEDSSMIECHLKEENEAKEIVRKLNVISTKDKDKDKEKEQERQEEESLKEDFKNQEVYLSNQKIQLCIALIEVSQMVELGRSRQENFLLVIADVENSGILICAVL